jgi:hypothetical protein
MTYTYCMTSTCPMKENCSRFENDAARHCVFRTYADFSEELIRGPNNAVSCPFYMDKSETPEANAA